MIGYIVRGLTLGFSAGATPGPFHALLTSLTLKGGWRRGLPAVFAPLLSDGPIILLMLVLLTQMPDVVLRLLQIAGGGFLLYLAWHAYQDFRHAGQESAVSAGSAGQSLRRATILNLLNPNPYIFWGVIGGPILLDGLRESVHYGVGFIAGFYVTLIGTFAGLVLLLATASHLGPRVTRVLSGVAAVALCLFGLYQLYAGLLG